MPKPKPSEWGKLSEGQSYIFWAIDFARAVSSVGLGENTGILFWYVAENSFGSIRSKRRGEWPDPLPVEIHCAALAETFGITKQRVYEAEKWLLKANMIYQGPAGYYVNKNAHEWVHPVSGSPLVSGKRLAYALAGRTRTNQSDQQPPSNVTPLPINEHGNHRVTLERDQSNGTTLLGGPESNGVTLLATIGTRPSEDSIQSNTEQRSAVPGRKTEPPTTILMPTPDGPGDPAMMQPYPGGMDPMDVAPGPHVLSDDDARQIYTRVWDAWGNMKLCREFYTHQRQHSADVWRSAIRELVEAGKVPGTVKFIRLRAGDIEVRPAEKPRGSNGRPMEKPAPAYEEHVAPADSPFRKLNEDARRRAAERGAAK